MDQLLIDEIRNKIRENKLEEALEDVLIFHQGTRRYDDFLLLKSRLVDLNKRVRLGIEETPTVSRNKITYATLNLIYDLSQQRSPFMAIHDLEYFTAREFELKQLEEAFFQQKKDISIIYGVAGLGGVGKSALAAHFAQLYRGKFPDGVFWIRVDENSPLQAARKIGIWLGKGKEIRKVFKVQNDENQFIEESAYAQSIISKWFQNKKALLVLDNADGEKINNNIRYYLPDGNSVSILVTTRNKWLPKQLKAEQLNLSSFNEDEGLALFQKIFLSDHDFKREIGDIKRLLSLLGGLPLAIDWAARSIKSYFNYSVSTYLEELSISKHLLVPQKVEKVIEACLEKSVKLLQPEEQKHFIALGACNLSGFSVETVKALIESQSLTSTQDFLNQMYDLSLVQRRTNLRFGLHPLVYSYVRKQKTFFGAELKHAIHWLNFIRKYSNDSTSDWEVLTPELDGIFSAWSWCQNKDNHEEGEIINKLNAEFAFFLRYFLDGEGYWTECIKRIPDALAAVLTLEKSSENLHIQFRIRRHLAIILRKSWELERAIALNQENIAFSKKHQNSEWVAQEKEQLARVYIRLEEFDVAESLLLEAREETSLDRYRGQISNSLGGLNRRRDELDKAITYFNNSLIIYLQLEDRQGIGATLGHLASTHLKNQNHEECIKHISKAITEYYDGLKIEVRGSIYQNLGFALEKTGRLNEALACYILSADICNRLNIPGWENQRPNAERDRLQRQLISKGLESQINMTQGDVNALVKMENGVKQLCSDLHEGFST